MKLAHFILVHNKPEQLRRLVSKLEHPDVFIFVHVDKKADIKSFEAALAHCKHVVFISKRIDVIWASYRMVEATIEAFKQILNYPIQFDYINILSGQDYPLKKTDSFLQFLSENPGKAFMQSEDMMVQWKEAVPRITRYHFVNLKMPGKYQFEKYINRVMPMRKMPGGLIGVGRSQWFTFTPKHAAYCIDELEQQPALKRFFKFTWGSDEFVFQTLLYNSIFRHDMVNQNYRYVDWSEGNPNPKILRIIDFELMAQTNAFFARKFDEESDPIILDEIDKQLLGKGSLPVFPSNK
jgi:hypothetical protein